MGFGINYRTAWRTHLTTTLVRFLNNFFMIQRLIVGQSLRTLEGQVGRYQIDTQAASYVYTGRDQMRQIAN